MKLVIAKKPSVAMSLAAVLGATTKQDGFTEGFAHLRPGSEYDLLYRAAVCRAGADWLVGINGTRLFTVLYHAKLNVGRVMTPTLALVVQREAEISAFQSSPFYVPELHSGSMTASGEKTEDKTVADRIVSDCTGKTATVTSVDPQEKTVQPPRLYDLTTLQRECNRYFGYTAQQTLDYLQSLYEKKLATYPRTDSQYLTEDMKAPTERLVAWLNGNMPFATGNGTLDLDRVIDNKKVSDHHAILPTMEISKTDLSALPAGERDVLSLVAMRLLCAVDKPHIYETVTAVLGCGGHGFTAKGKTVKQDGWKAVLSAFKAGMKQQPQESDEEEAALPTLTVGQVLSDVQASVREGKTSPPKHFTEDSLLAAMETAGAEDMPEDAERKGLGTPATRAATLEKLVFSGFIQRKKKQLLPTEKGVNLIAVLPEKIKSPQLTAEWESMLKQVERGELTKQAFMTGIRELTTGLVQEHTAPDPAFTALFAPENTSPSIGSCPRCGGEVRERQKGFFCENPDCAFALWKENRFFSTKKKSLTKTMAAALLKEGRVAVSGLYSEKTGKAYDATVVLDDTGGKYVNFKLEFPARKSNKKKGGVFMSITPVTTEDLRRMWNQDGLVIQGCGGDLNEWVDGINELLEQTGILRNGSKFESVMTFQNGETTCLLFPFEGVDVDIGKLALWRLDTVAEFGGTWLSDYVDNRLGGFLGAEPEKPDCPLIGQDGNIFNLVGIAARTLRQNDMPEQAKAMTERVFASGSYNEALCIIGEYVNITSAEEMQERRSSVRQALQAKPETPTPKTHKAKEPER